MGEFCWIQLLANQYVNPLQVSSAHVLCLSLQMNKSKLNQVGHSRICAYRTT